MKKLFAILLTTVTLFAGSNVFAQGKWGADSAECVLHISYYRDYLKQKSYDDAMRNWRVAYKLCPVTSSYNLLVDGGTLVKDLIRKNGRNAEYKKALIDTLMNLYDQRAEFYPKYIVTSLNNKGSDLHNLVKNDAQKLHEGFSGIVNALEEKTKPTIYLYDYQALTDLLQTGDAEAETLISAYQRYGELLDKIQPKTEAEKEQIASVKNDLSSLFAQSNVATCDNLIEIFTPRFEAEPENATLASNIVRTMNIAEDCAGNDLYLKAVTVMHNSEPSSTSAYALYKLNANQDNVDEAVKYLQEAIDFEDSDLKQDAEYTYQLATYLFKNGRNAQAYETALRAAKMDDEFEGKSYFLAGMIWGGTRCGGNEITSRANCWVACDYFAKAKAADPSLTEEANSYIGKYSAYFPETADAFMYNLNKGQSFTASCGGMTAVTTVRTR